MKINFEDFITYTFHFDDIIRKLMFSKGSGYHLSLEPCFSINSLFRLMNSRRQFFHFIPPIAHLRTNSNGLEQGNGTQQAANQQAHFLYMPQLSTVSGMGPHRWINNHRFGSVDGLHLLMQYCSFQQPLIQQTHFSRFPQTNTSVAMDTNVEATRDLTKSGRKRHFDDNINSVTSVSVQNHQGQLHDLNLLSSSQIVLNDSEGQTFTGEQLQSCKTSRAEDAVNSEDDQYEFHREQAAIKNYVLRHRTWQYTKPKEGCDNTGLEFSVMSYNVLAQQLLYDNLTLYRHCNEHILKWEVRSQNLIQEIKESNASILCLQEVQQTHYEGFFVPELEILGYKGLYKKRTGSKNDGCAIFFQKKLFSLESYETVEFYRENVRSLDRDNIGLIAILRPQVTHTQNDMKLVVATTHLLFNPRRGDIKLGQLRLLLAEVDKFAFRGFTQKSQQPIYHPIILCGDMNSKPFSPLYNFLVQGRLRYDGILSGDVSGQPEGSHRGRPIFPTELVHPLLGISEKSQYLNIHKERMKIKLAERMEALSGEDRKKLISTDQASIKTDEKLVEDQGSGGESSLQTFTPSGSRDCWTDEGSSPVKEGYNNCRQQGKDVEIIDQSTSYEMMANLQSDVLRTSSVERESNFVTDQGEKNKHPEMLQQPEKSKTREKNETSGLIRHRLNLVSVYTHKTPFGEPEVTTQHSKANCTVDYIFYSVKYKSKNHLKEGPLQLLGWCNLLSEAQMNCIGLPNAYQGSDHLSLIAKFRLNKY
ncbi:uncharacterized protein LOC106466894 [Limulus polyphemus]|uniref:Uncharacterized protein LOC106466894 n=1 Tax=Limulus polyphemus TaxID=6850 RepID=A0ABM1T471_LIMPO|nr:uncharacterized protein LOC106466894 [Limulus polyphemus]XP_022250673.1 uncharacterized protein LOC106466894 [Limulus polyphemus]XP_022250674.1 uncharacterized protein LOC106466894 [Limulus polyphemus]XP_022250676.1 uncharacterized protein LOC106466894 [Limulus polyphemus]XP_022250677.1 uncharacterized protein LOC106466894 [Limulus polyphemus]